MPSDQLAAWALAGLTFGVAVLATWMVARRGLRRQAAASVWLLVLAHPGIWLTPEPVGGDRSLLHSSLIFTILAVVLSGWISYRPVSSDADESGDKRSPRP